MINDEFMKQMLSNLSMQGARSNVSEKQVSQTNIISSKELTVEALEIQQIIKATMVDYTTQYRLPNDVIELLQQFNQCLEAITGQSQSPYLQALQIIYVFKEQQCAGFAELLENIKKNLETLFLNENNLLADWERHEVTASISALEQVLNADFANLLKNKNLVCELQNIERTKDFILHQIKHKSGMSCAERQAYIHELREIKMMLEQRKAELAAHPDLIAADNLLLTNLAKLKKLIQVGFHVLLNSNKSTDLEKAQFNQLSSELNSVINLPKIMTQHELVARIKTLAAAKVFLDKWLPEIAKRQSLTCEDEITPLPQKATFFGEQRVASEQSDVISLARFRAGISAN